MRMKLDQCFVIIIWMIAGFIAASLNSVAFTILFSSLIIGFFMDKSGYYVDGAK